MGDERRRALSRRGALAAGTAGLAALAGCTGVFDRDPFDGGESTPTYDPGTIATAVDGDVPRPPAAFPVTVPASMVDRHRSRARELLDAVPEEPTVPNGVVTEKLREQRRDVVESLADGEEREGESPLDRLRSARWVRAEAANVRGAYRAATGDADTDAVAERRDALRGDLYAFLDGWEYRGADAVETLVVHRRVERLVDECRGPLESGSAFPETPIDAVFRAGDIVADLERADAALTDAATLRDRFVDEGDPSRRDAIVAAADALGAAAAEAEHSVHGHLDGGSDDESFERDIEGTPAEFLYDVATDLVRWRRDERREARERGAHATAVVETGVTLAGAEAVSTVVEAIRDGEYGRPTEASRVGEERERAVSALQAAWATEPTPVSVVLARPARAELGDGVRRLDSELDESSASESVPSTHVNWAMGSMAYAKHYARATPAAVDRVAGTLREAADGS